MTLQHYLPACDTFQIPSLYFFHELNPYLVYQITAWSELTVATSSAQSCRKSNSCLSASPPVMNWLLFFKEKSMEWELNFAGLEMKISFHLISMFISMFQFQYYSTQIRLEPSSQQQNYLFRDFWPFVSNDLRLLSRDMFFYQKQSRKYLSWNLATDWDNVVTMRTTKFMGSCLR